MGIPVGSDLEFADEVTMSRSLKTAARCDDTLESVLVSISSQPDVRSGCARLRLWAITIANSKIWSRGLKLHTVCESAACPNVGECWNRRTATFMILGNVCTRRCGFCAVQKGGPLPVDYDEPRRVGEACRDAGAEVMP